MNIGKAIKMCRTQRGVSQEILAHKANCSISYLSMLENNKRDPTLSTLESIAKALQIPLGIIFFLGSESDEIKGLDRGLAGDLARTALELLSEPIRDTSTSI